MKLNNIVKYARKVSIFCVGVTGIVTFSTNTMFSVRPIIDATRTAPMALKPFAFFCSFSAAMSLSTIKSGLYASAWPIAWWSFYHRYKLYKATGEIEWILVSMTAGASIVHKDKYLHIPRYDLLRKS